MPVYDPEAEHNQILKDPERVTRKRDLKNKTIIAIDWGDEFVYIRFEDDSLATLAPGHNPEIHLSDSHYGVSAQVQNNLGYITDAEYEEYKRLKREWKEEERRKERKRRFESLREEFGHDLTDEEIEELKEIRERLNNVLG